MCRITNSAKRNKMKIQKSRFGKFNLKYDVIHDALKVICNENFKRPRNFGDMGTCRNLAKNREIA